jgi:hypothetical protein
VTDEQPVALHNVDAKNTLSVSNIRDHNARPNFDTYAPFRKAVQVYRFLRGSVKSARRICGFRPAFGARSIPTLSAKAGSKHLVLIDYFVSRVPRPIDGANWSGLTKFWPCQELDQTGIEPSKIAMRGAIGGLVQDV